MRKITLPDSFGSRVESGLSALGYSLNHPAPLAEAVQKLSSYYIDRPDAPTPWREKWTRAAYVAYFFPLNYARVAAVIYEGQRLGFFSGLSRLVDFGSGVGTVPLALHENCPTTFLEQMAIEKAPEPVSLFSLLKNKNAPMPNWVKDSPRGLTKKGEGCLTSFSYSLTELPAIPSWALESEALMLIEPATHQDARRLHGMREMLAANGFHIWAPCTHEGPCPLLTHSQRDWCHDRVVWEMPEWFTELSAHLPMRNPTLTVSYLLARKSLPPAGLAGLGRLTGDLKREKGASRQMICRGPEREFLSWQKRDGEAPEWPKGELVQLATNITVKGPELRPTKDQARLLDGEKIAP